MKWCDDEGRPLWKGKLAGRSAETGGRQGEENLPGNADGLRHLQGRFESVPVHGSDSVDT